ncbi:hypothetical protein H5410_041836 [Solanum commersonii]|uniref:Uncharacterized protein n=1 Tax=Solanum commersonii TaxID=4109 RepID=A0A9J5XUA3_SOLCO|nr:hypothetical protein H5410_041836 [Solanum commersonii]
MRSKLAGPIIALPLGFRRNPCRLRRTPQWDLRLCHWLVKLTGLHP